MRPAGVAATISALVEADGLAIGKLEAQPAPIKPNNTPQ